MYVFLTANIARHKTGEHAHKNNSRFKTLVVLIYVCFFIGSLTPLIIFFVSDYSAYKKEMISRIEKKLIAVSIIAKKNTNDFFDSTTRGLESMARFPSVSNFLRQTETDLTKTGLDLKHLLNTESYLKTSAEISQKLKPYHPLYDFHDFYIMDPSGNIIFSLRQDKNLGLNVISGELGNTLFSKACLQSLDTGKPSCSDLEVFGATDKKAFFFITQIIAGSNGKKAGLAALKFKASRLSTALERHDRNGEDLRVFIVGKDSLLRGGYIQPKDTEKDPLKLKVILPYSRRNKDNRFGTYMRQGGEIFAGTMSVLNFFEQQGPEWYLVSETPYHPIETLLTNYKQKALLYLSLAACFAFGFSFFIVRRTVRPVQQLTKWAQQTATGNIIAVKGAHLSSEMNRLYTECGRVADRLKELINYCNTAASGNFSTLFPVTNANDDLGKSVNAIGDYFTVIVDMVNQITRGNYSISAAPHAKNDEIGPALSKMSEALHQMNQENFRQISTTYAQMELIKQISGEQDLLGMTNNLLSFLCSYFNAQSGVFYISGKNNNILQLSGSHGCMRAQLPECVEPGEGLAGQALLEKNTIMTNVCPENYTRIVSGLGDSKPSSLLVYPFLFRDEVIAVMEIASLHPLETNSLDFLSNNCESISIAINSAITRTLMAELLEQTIDQSSILKIKQEELENANLDLASQTKALKKSQARLMSREEDLRDANKELEAHSRHLETQKADLDQKNKELQAAKSNLETKAMELELSNRHKSEFLANMSHELRTPLNSIILLSKLMSENKSGTLSQKQTEFTSIINKSGTELLNLINEILDLSKITSGTMSVNPSVHILEDTKKKLERLFQKKAADKGLNFSVKLEKKLPESIMTDAYKLDQILINFLSNALKFSETGQISVQIRRPGKNVTLSQHHLDHENTIEFSVADTGIGIAEDKQQMIFEAFKQADGSITRIHGGSGLGLTISIEFTKLLDGEIHLKSTLGEGSSFSLFLPEKMKKRNVEPEHSTPNEVIIRKFKKTPSKTENKECQSQPYVPDDRNTISRHSKSVLMIEDDPGLLKIMQKHARNLKFKSLIAERGETGLFMAEYFRPNAIILDIGLPGIDGFSVMNRLKGNPLTRHIPVYFISGMNHKIKALKMGAIGFLLKPIALPKLDQAFETINRVIDGRSRNLLVVGQHTSEISLLEGSDMDIFTEENPDNVIKTIADKNIGCIVFNHGKHTGKHSPFLKKIKAQPDYFHIPVVINTAHVPQSELNVIETFAHDMIIHHAPNPEILLNETTIFLHRDDAQLSHDKISILNKMHGTTPVLKDKNILLVDDDIKNVFAVTGILEDAGLNVYRAENGQKALEILDNNPIIDLVLMDIMMPVMDGYEAIRQINKRDEFKKLPIIALTAKAIKGDRGKCIEAGASDYLSKPVDIDKLITLMRVWLY